MEIIGLASSPQSSGSYALILQETGGLRRLSILIGQDLAQSIALKLEDITPPRPITHDLLKSIIDALGANLQEVTITELREGTYYATLTFDATPTEIDSRPSDAIALAVRCGVPIFVSEEVLAEAGVIPQEDDEFDDDDDYDESGEFDEEGEQQERPKSLREVLQDKLDEAVKNEDYERAAQLRDEIDSLDNQSSS